MEEKAGTKGREVMPMERSIEEQQEREAEQKAEDEEITSGEGAAPSP